MSRRKKKNSTNPSRSHANTFRKRIIPTPRRQELGTRTIIFEDVAFDYPAFFTSIGRLSRDRKMSDELFRVNVTGVLSTSINLELLLELEVDTDIVKNILKISREAILEFDSLPPEVLTTARTFIADGMPFREAIIAAKMI